MVESENRPGVGFMDEKVLFILTTGPEDRGNRATLAFAMALEALKTGVAATLFMTQGGVYWSRRHCTERVHIEGFEALDTYIGQFLEAGGQLMVCRPSSAVYRSGAADRALIDGVELCDPAPVADLAMSASTITL